MRASDGTLVVPGEFHSCGDSGIKGTVLTKATTLDANVRFYSHTAPDF